MRNLTAVNTSNLIDDVFRSCRICIFGVHMFAYRSRKCIYLFITSLHAECDAPVTLANGDFRMTAMLLFYTTKKSLQFVYF